MRSSLALIGLPASGKTSVGRILAGFLGLAFADLDAELEAEAGMTVGSIFRLEGEPGFRVRESAALSRLSGAGPLVLATGGGCVESAANRALLAGQFFTVWLRASPMTCAARAASAPPGSRPLLAGDALSVMEALLSRREAWYRDCAKLTVEADLLGPEELAEAIRDAIR